jgi:hypothetical protein
MLLLEEGWEVACCGDEGAALAFGELAATRPADVGPDDVKICVDDEPSGCADDVNAWVETGAGDEARLPDLNR